MTEQNTDIEPKKNKPWQFQPGQTGNPSGKNGRDNLKEFKAKLKSLGFDTIEEVINLFRTTDKDKVKCDLLIALLAREYASLKAIELSSESGTHFSLQILQKSDAEIEKAKEELKNDS